MAKVEVFALCLGDALVVDHRPYARYFSKERLQAILRRSDNKNRNHTIRGELLAKHLLSERTKVSLEDIAFKRTPQGKPYWEGMGFNISHSGKWVAVAVGDVCGVDVETKRKNNLAVAKRFFLPQEAAFLERQENPIPHFLCMWTIKESYVKFTGKGIAQLTQVDCQTLLHGKGDIGTRVFSLPQGAFLSVTSKRESLPHFCTLLQPTGSLLEFETLGQIESEEWL